MATTPALPGDRSAGGDSPVESLLRGPVEATGYVLEGVTTTAAGRRSVVRVVVDLPADRTGAMDLDAVAEVSRVVSDALDGSSVLGGSPYVLEVTTPGVDRPLTEGRHWSRARGRVVTVEVDGRSVSGRVVEVTGTGVVLTVDDAPSTVTWARLGAGRVQVEFRHHDEHDDQPDEDVPDDDAQDDDAPDDDAQDEEG